MDSDEKIYFESFPSHPRKGDKRRLEILQATIHCVAKEGYAGSTFDRVAKQLKTRRSHITYYFADREALLLEVIQFITAVAQKITLKHVMKAESPLEKIVAISEGAYAWSESHPDQGKFMLMFYFICTYETSFRKLHTEIREAGFQRLKSLLQEIAPRPVAQAEIDKMAKTLQGLMTGLLIEQSTTSRTSKWNYRKLTQSACREWIQKRSD